METRHEPHHPRNADPLRIAFLRLARDLSTKVMQDNPGVSGAGTTVNPTAKPETGGIAEQAMRISPGVNGPGTTANPTAEPAARGLAEEAMQDHPGVNR